MFWKILLILLILLLTAFLVLLFIPILLRVSYEEGEFRISLRYASRKVVLFPTEKSEKMTESHADGEHDSTSKKRKKSNESSGIATKPNFEQISYTLDVLPGVVVRALKRTARCVRISPLKIHVLVAVSDPADTAVLYGKLHGVLDATLPLVHRCVRIDDQDIQLFPDFTQDGMDCIADIGVRIRPFDILSIAVLAAGGVIKWYIGYKRRADKVESAENRKQKSTAQADPAA